MGKEIATQVQEAQRVKGRINPRRNTRRHIVIKLAKIKDKEKLLKAARGQRARRRGGMEEGERKRMRSIRSQEIGRAHV